MSNIQQALGSYGSFVSCSKYFHKIIVNTCGGLIYSTVLPPSVLGAIFAALKKIPNISPLRKNYLKNSFFFTKNLKSLNLNIAGSNSQIIPIILKDHKKCKKLFNYLFDCGFYVKEVRPPTVPKGLDELDYH